MGGNTLLAPGWPWFPPSLWSFDTRVLTSASLASWPLPFSHSEGLSEKRTVCWVSEHTVHGLSVSLFCLLTLQVNDSYTGTGQPQGIKH